jgi:chromate reductase
MPAMQQPEVYLQKVNELFDKNGVLKEGTTKEFLQKAVNAYIVWFKRNAE